MRQPGFLVRNITAIEDGWTLPSFGRFARRFLENPHDQNLCLSAEGSKSYNFQHIAAAQHDMRRRNPLDYLMFLPRRKFAGA
jgi:hypothetical protein